VIQTHSDEAEMASPCLRDRRVLVVEDEYLIAVSLRDHLQAIGSTVIGPVPSVEKAIQLIESNPRIDAAILDLNLGGSKAYPVADALQARKIPFIFASGYGDEDLSDLYPNVRNCQKPCPFDEMEAFLASALSG
jgi:CheY-like chemotaxis protein